MLNSRANSSQGYGRGKTGSSTKPQKTYQLNREIEQGKVPENILQFDPGNPDHGEKPHVHFKDGSALNKDGSWKHGKKELRSSEIKYLQKMDRLSQNKLIEWLDEFDISSAHMDSQHIDAFAPICLKSQWVEIAFGLYDISLKTIQKRGYPFFVFLALYLNAKKTPSKHTPRKMVFRYFSHQDTPPELYLIKDPSTIKKWQKVGLPLAQLSARYGGVALFDEFYSEDEKQYVRTIFFYKEGGFPFDL